MRGFVPAMLLVLPLFSALPVTAPDAHYEIRDLIKAHDPGFAGQGFGAHAIDDDGVIVGLTGQSPTRSNPFYTVNGRAKRVTAGRFGGDRTTDPEMLIGGIEDHIAVACLDGTLIDLESVVTKGKGWTLMMIRGANRVGQMIGLGERAGERRAFVLTPVE